MNRATAAISAAAMAACVIAAPAKQKVVVVNEDNDHYFKQDSALMTVEALEAYIDKMAGGKVTHFFMCPSGQRPSYGSKVWEPIWTGLDEPNGLKQGVYTTWAKHAKLLFDKGIDPYEVWIRQCRKRGISPWLSPRMNDCHNADQQSPFRSTTFWREHDELHCEPGYRGGDCNRATFNFALDAVQDYTFALVKEQLDRYDIDGYELDFMRFYDHFPRKVAAKSSHHLDRFVKRVKDYADAKAAERGHPILLGVRVAPTPAGARSKGCDVGRWVREGWVDWVCASTYWETPDYNTPVAEWRKWFGDMADKVMLLAGTDHGLASTHWDKGGIRLDMEMKYYAGFADVQWGNGVDGIYLFNIPYLDAAFEKVCRQGLFPQDIESQVRAFPVSYRWEAWGGSPSDLQLSRKSDRPNEFKVRLGAHPSGRVSVVIGTLENGAFIPEVTLNGIAATGSCAEVMKIRPTAITHKGVDYYCRRYFFPDNAVHGGADNIVRVEATAEPKTIVWCEIDLTPPCAPDTVETPVFKGGLWRTFEYDEPSAAPIYFCGESRSENAAAPDYCIHLDIWYDDGTPVWAVRADWPQGTHDWVRTAGAFVPARPVKKIKMHAFLRKGTGNAEFRNLSLERREGNGEILGSAQTMTERPYADRDLVIADVFTGRKVSREVIVATGNSVSIANPLSPDETVVWTADSMRQITPLTFPDAATRKSARPTAAHVSLARRERESFQVQISTGAKAEWTDGGVTLPVLRDAKGTALKGSLEWRRVGYVARDTGYYSHPCGAPQTELWLPDPLLPPAPFKVRKGSTQGLWFTVYAAPDAAAGEYSGDIVLTERGERRAKVHVTAKVEDFALPETFGMATSFSVMDSFTRAQYPDHFKEKKRESWDIMLDHRLNPDNISRTVPPDIDDLLYARSRGMNLFNILNIVPEPKDKNTKWVCYSPPEATESPAFYPAFKARLAPYVAELRKHGLDKFAYLYGFDERGSEYYPGIDALWQKLKADFPDIPVMTTAMMYRDYAAGNTNLPCLVTTDWYCPLTDVYRSDVSDEMRKRGKMVWWYVCCEPRYPYANFASLEYPFIEGRLLGWMTHLYRADGLLYWHVNFWNGPCIDESDTFLPTWKTYSSLHMPGDGVLLYPGKNHIMPSIRLAQVRDAVEDYEWLQLAAAKVGEAAVDSIGRTIVQSMTDFTRDSAAVLAARRRLANRISALLNITAPSSGEGS